jgi:DNA modification methylase
MIDIRLGDCLDVMKDISEKSIDCIITSPPYWNQRDYENDKQWGNEKTMEEYIDKILLWGDECKRILKDEGSMFLNIGDKYSKKGLSLIPERIVIKLSDNGWCLRNTIIWHKPNHMPTSVKDRLCNTYEYVYFFVKSSGKYFNFDYYNNIDNIRIKQVEDKKSKKSIDFPDTIEFDEYESWVEKINEFNKNKEKNYNGKFKNQDLNIGQSPAGRQSVGISYSLQRKNKIDKNTSLEINKFIKHYAVKNKKTSKQIDLHFGNKDTASHWLRTDNGKSLPKPEDWMKLKEFLEIDDDKYDKIMTEIYYVSQNVKNNPLGKNPGDLWIINTEKCKESHFAVFPTELPRRIISAFCPENGIVLDTFAGSGTTGLAANELNRKCILIECNPEFIEIMNKRIKIEL